MANLLYNIKTMHMVQFEVFCKNYLARFKHQAKAARRVGVEKEILAVDEFGHMANIGGKVWPRLLEAGYKPVFDEFYKEEIVGFWVGEDQIALDAGKGTFEIILTPYESVQSTERRMKEVLKIILPICTAENIRMIALGYQPKAVPARENWNHKQRYEVLLDHFGKDVCPASLSASDQVHIDVVQSEIVQVINTMNGMAGFFVVLFANCPVFVGPNRFKAFREVIWDALGADRTGLPLTPVSSVEDYLGRLWDLNCMMAYNGEKYFSPDVPFRDYVAGMNDEETFKAYCAHEGSVWFCARPRVYGTIEMRPAALQPWNDMVAVSALTLGLMENLNESEMFVRQFRWDTLRAMRLDAVRDGFGAKLNDVPVAGFTREVLELAVEGLKKRMLGEEKYLDCLFERVEKQKAPVDIGRDYFKSGGMDLLLEKSSLKEEHLII